MNNKNIKHSKYSSFQFERTFEINDSHKKITIWKAYHNENQIQKYNLFENERIFLFNTSNLGYAGKNINHLNRLFCEGVCLLYPYFNNLKSDIIGFQHYRRWYHSGYDNLKIEDIKNNKIQIFTDRGVSINFINTGYRNIANHCYFWRIYDNGFYDDLIEYLSDNYPQYLEGEKNLHNFHGFSLFVCTWEMYIKFCNLLWGYLLFIANKYHFNVYSENDWVEFIKEHFILYNRYNNISSIKYPWASDHQYGENNWIYDDYLNDQNSFHYYRIFSFNVEFFVSMFAHNEGYIYDKNNVINFVS